MRFAVVLDGTVATAASQAAALAGFLCDGLSDGRGAAASEAHGELSGETFVFYADDRDKRRLVDLAPTRDVRLVKTTARRPDLMVDSLIAPVRGGGIELVLTAGGAAGAEVATRLACRARGAVLTGALSVAVGSEQLHGRRAVYSSHLIGRFALSARPWCVSIDASWSDGARDPGPELAPGHEILSDTDETRGSQVASIEDVELLEAPAANVLARSRFLVVAGYGAGSREGAERIARAARRMGADFGASRPVVMNSWAPLDRLIGVSGCRAAPVLCIVVGASGAPALHWGIERAAFVVALNPDEHAPIVANSDAAVLDDGLTVIEALAEIVRP